MRKFLIATLLVKLVCLLVLCQTLWVLAESGSAGGSADECAGDFTKYSLDANGDAFVDISDVIWSLTWMFSGGQVPQVCLDSTDLEANLATAEGERDVALADLTTIQGALTAAETAQATAEAALSACLAPPPPPAGFTFFATNAEGYDEYTHDASGIRFVHLPGGEFEMGSPEDETGRFSNEGPVHTVSLSPFLIAKYEVTQAQYAAVMTEHVTLNATPSFFAGDDLPVEQVSWDDLHLDDGFLERTELVLPSEAQWEYACRAGTSGPYSGTGNLDDMGWYDGNSGGLSQDVGTKQANDFGLHDMHGNVLEWCRDVYDEAFYGSDFAYGPDPSSTGGSVLQVVRGGSFFNFARDARSANRIRDFPAFRRNRFGFRPARPLP